MLEVADIFHRYGDEYLDRYGEKMLPSHHRAFQDILNCRTEAMGGHLFACDHCGHQIYSYHSCRNRSCPKCHGDDTEDWLKNRRKELLPVEFQMIRNGCLLAKIIWSLLEHYQEFFGECSWRWLPKNCLT